MIRAFNLRDSWAQTAQLNLSPPEFRDRLKRPDFELLARVTKHG